MSHFAGLSVAVAVYFGMGRLLGADPPLRRFATRDRSTTIQSWLLQAGVVVTPGVFLVGSAATALAAVWVLAGLSGTMRIAIGPGLAVGATPFVIVGRRRSRRLAAVQAAWPDGLRHVLAGVRSGMTLPTAVGVLGVSGPEELRRLFEPFRRLVATFGFEAALDAVRADVADPTTDRIVEVLRVAHEAGGRLVVEILEDLAAATTADLQALEEVATNALEMQLNARIVFVLPWLVLVLLTTAEGPFRDFYSQEPAGLAVITVGAVLSLAGSVLMHRLGRRPVEPRVLTPGASR